jgi:hypothetical protein
VAINSKRAISSAAIIAALGYTPADAGAVVMSDGTAAAPGMKFGSTTDLGFYLRSANIMGIAVEGLQHTSFQYQNVLGTNDGAMTRMGRSQTHSAGSAAYAYPVTVFIETQTISSNTPIVMYDIGLGDCRVSDTTTQAVMSGTIENDKTDVYGDGGAVLFSAGWAGLIQRLAIPKTDVTFANNYGITFTIPASADVTGTVTNTKLIHLPTSASGASSTYYGIFQDTTYNGATIGSAEDADIKITAGVSGSATADIILNAKISGGVVDIQTTDRLIARFGTVGASVNGFEFTANNTPLLRARHATGANNVGLQLSSQSAGSVDFLTGTGTLTQVRVLHTANAANSVSLTGAAAGANPRVGSSAENLTLGTGAAIATGATAGFIMIPGMAGTPSGAPTAAGAGAVPFVYDTSANKLWAYNGSWRSVTLA